MAYLRQNRFLPQVLLDPWNSAQVLQEFPPRGCNGALPLPLPIVYGPSAAAGASACACGGHLHDGFRGGLGLFDSGLDLSQWGFGEWAVAGLTAYGLFAFVLPLLGGVKRVRRHYRQKERTSERRAELKRELEALR
jgi:hypothetical protein